MFIDLSVLSTKNLTDYMLLYNNQHLNLAYWRDTSPDQTVLESPCIFNAYLMLRFLNTVGFHFIEAIVRRINQSYRGIVLHNYPQINTNVSYHTIIEQQNIQNNTIEFCITQAELTNLGNFA